MTTMKAKRLDRNKYDIDGILDYCEAISTAAKAGNREEVIRLGVAMPLLPPVARSAVMVMGKKEFLAGGYDRTLADAEYGEQWIDEVDDERFALTGMRD